MINTVGVVGLGTMGAGIAEVFARAGLSVTAVEVDEAALERGRGTLTGSVDRAHAKGRLSDEQRQAVLDRIRFAAGLPALSDVDLVVEAVPERIDIKHALFAELDRICAPHAVLATNTSSLPVTEIAAGTHRPQQVVGMHFFNPAPVMSLVEVIHTVLTAEETVAAVRALSERLGKVPVTVGDRAGFVANALLFGYLNDAVVMLESGHATREDIDTAMRSGAGLPMGPLALLDLIGLDTACEILDTLYHRGGRDRRHAAAPLLRQLVTAGMLGRKTGQGFYPYEQPGAPAGADPRPFSTVGVVGDAGRLAGSLRASGHDVVTTAADPDQLDKVASADLVVAAGEGRDQVTSLFAALDQVCRPDAVLVCAAARVPVIEAAMATRRPGDVAGLRLVGDVAEVVHSVRTSPEAAATVRAMAGAAGATPVQCRDRAGGIVDALLLPHLNDAVRMLESGYASADDIDAAMTRGCGYPAGPLAMADQRGLDQVLAGLHHLYQERREPGLAPAPLLEQLVTARRGMRV